MMSPRTTQISLTPEQLSILDRVVSSSRNIKIQAFAGTGKTFTLRQLAYAMPQKKILYIAFNKSVQQEAHATFPPNVLARTMHSLAFQALRIGEGAWRQKLERRMTMADYARFLGVRITTSSMQKIYSLKDALKEFLYTSDPTPSSRHIPTTTMRTIRDEAQRKMIRRFVDRHAPLMWKAMLDPKREDIGLSHDGYLKMWELKKPIIPGVDIIFLDEAQDINPAVVSILQNQPTRLILVGDPWQQIYSFRGAVNAMDQLKAHDALALTQSFRFGTPIADLANIILKRQLSSHRIVGDASRVSRLEAVDEGQPFTVIFRYNIELFSEAFALAQKGKRLFVMGSMEESAKLILDVFHLYSEKKREIKDPRVKVFRDWNDLEMNYDILDDDELRKSFRFVEAYKKNVSHMIQQVKKACVLQESQADVTLITGHKAKGREWSQVRLFTDFAEALTDKAHEEWNLLYVAVTRAKNRLEIPPVIESLLCQ